MDALSPHNTDFASVLNRQPLVFTVSRYIITYTTNSEGPEMRLRHCILGLLCLAWAAPAATATITVAVAANFTAAARQLAQAYSASSGDKVLLSFGSTGKLYAQIRNGAPYDTFLAADARRPRLLEQQGTAIKGSRFTYARGKLVLWSPQPGLVDNKGSVLRTGSFSHLAIANPRTAPYGAAAQQVLAGLGLWNKLQPRLIRGENIAQAYQFVAGGGAALGFVAWSEVHHPGQPLNGSYWDIPSRLYAPIDQQAVLLRDRPESRAFMRYLRSPAAAQVIESFGYTVPRQP